VGVVLPREADAAEHLDGVLGALEGGRGHQRGRHGGSQRRLGRVATPGGVPHRGAGVFEGAQHVGTAVLHGLELADHPTELLALAGVGGGGLDAPPHQPDRLGGQQHRGQLADPDRIVDRTEPPVGGHRRVGHRHAGQAPRGIDARELLDLGLVAVEHHPHLARSRAGRQHQQVGHGGAEHGTDLTRHHQPAVVLATVEHRTAEGHGADELAGGQAGNEAVAHPGAAEPIDGEGRHGRRHERTGRHGASELLEHHHELGQPVPLTSRLVGDGEAEPAETDEVRPEGRPFLGGRVERGARRADRRMGLDPAARCGGELFVLGRDAERGPNSRHAPKCDIRVRYVAPGAGGVSGHSPSAQENGTSSSE